jgi:hypothetical protein
MPHFSELTARLILNAYLTLLCRIARRKRGAPS